MSCTPTLSCDAYRLRNDNGNETTATWLYNENVSGTVAYDTNFRICFVAQVTNACAATNRIFQLQYSLNSGTWTDVNASSAVIRSSASPNLADAANLTDQMTTGSGTFIGTTGFDEVDGAAGGNSLDIAASGQAQVEYCVQIRSVDVRSGGSVRLRIVDTQANLATWNQTPTLPLAPITIPLTDPWANLDDTTPTIDKQDLGATPITPPEMSDPMPAYGERLGLALSYSGDSMTMADVPPTVERRRLGWLDSFTFDKQDVGLTAISKDLGTDNLAVYGERVGLGLELRGDTMPLADTTPVIDERGILRYNIAADPWENLADTTPTIDKRGILTANIAADPMPAYGERLGLAVGLSGDSMTFADQPAAYSKIGILTAAPAADPWENLADTIPTVDKQVIATTPINVPITADPWGNLGDTTPTYSEFGYLTADAPTDPNINYEEKIGLGVGLFGDSMQLADTTPTVDKVELGTTPITQDLGTDDLNNWADTPNKERRRLGWLDSISTDLRVNDQVGGSITDSTWPTYVDNVSGMFMALLVGRYIIFVDESGNKIVIDEYGNYLLAEPGLLDYLTYYTDSAAADKQSLGTTPITRDISADNWGTLADTTPTVSERGFYNLTLSDPWANLADQPPTTKYIGILTATHAADPWANLADAPPTISKLDIPITRNLTADPWANLADTTPVVDERGFLSVSVTDPWGNLADQTPTVTTTNFLDKTYDLGADALPQYGEMLGLGEGMRDPWANLADETPTVVKIGILKANITADPWANLADQTPTVAKTTLKIAAPSADPNVAYGERLGTGRGFTDDLANYGERFGLGIRITDDLNGWQDAVQANTGGNYSYTLSDSTLQNWADQPDQNYGKLYGLPADAMSMGDTTPTYTIGIEVSVSDDLVNYDDSTDRIEGLSVGLTDDLANYLEEVRIRGIVPAEIIRLSGQLNSNIGLSGKLEDRLGLSGTLKHGKIGITGKLYDGGG